MWNSLREIFCRVRSYISITTPTYKMDVHNFHKQSSNLELSVKLLSKCPKWASTLLWIGMKLHSFFVMEAKYCQLKFRPFEVNEQWMDGFEFEFEKFSIGGSTVAKNFRCEARELLGKLLKLGRSKIAYKKSVVNLFDVIPLRTR